MYKSITFADGNYLGFHRLGLAVTTSQKPDGYRRHVLDTASANNPDMTVCNTGNIMALKDNNNNNTSHKNTPSTIHQDNNVFYCSLIWEAPRL